MDSEIVRVRQWAYEMTRADVHEEDRLKAAEQITRWVLQEHHRVVAIPAETTQMSNWMRG